MGEQCPSTLYIHIGLEVALASQPLYPEPWVHCTIRPNDNVSNGHKPEVEDVNNDAGKKSKIFYQTATVKKIEKILTYLGHFRNINLISQGNTFLVSLNLLAEFQISIMYL